MLTTQERERATEADAIVILGGFSLVGRRERKHAGASVLARIAREVEQGRVAMALATVVAEVDLPVVGKPVIEIDEVGLEGSVPLAPVGGGGLRAAPVGATAVRIPDRQATPHRRVGIAFLPAQAKPQRGVGSEVDIHGAIQGLTLGRVHIDPGVAFVGFCDQTPSDSAFGVQRTGHIGFDAIGVPGAGPQFQRAFQISAVGALAHHVDGCGWIAGTRHQAVGTAYYFNAVIHGQAAENFTRTPWLLKNGGDAIDHQRIEFKATGVELRPTGLVTVDRHTRGVIDHVENRTQVLVLYALLRDDADRLRRFPQRHTQRRGRACSLRRV
ncbi:hypothetical protein D3C81_1179260 [compost metagenome]